VAISLDPALPTQLRDLQASAARFWSWWTGELAAMVPAGLRRRLAPGRPLLAIDLADGGVTLHPGPADGRGEPLGRLPLHADPASRRGALTALLQDRRSAGLGLAITMPGVLLRQIELPAAAAGDLDAVLRLDMDRQTPFRAEDVRFSHRLIGRQPASGTITVALAVAPKAACAGPEALAAELGLPLAYLGPRGGPPWSDNLWSPPVARGRRRLLRGLAVLAAALALLALWLPLERDRRAAEAVAARVAEASALQARLAAERDQLAGLREAARAVAGAEAQALPLLADIAAALPLDAWLERLDWRDGQVELAGRARATTEIVARLAAQPRFGAVGYLAPVTRGEDGLERFSLTVELAAAEPEAPAEQAELQP
jgi:general secretion pathway protein L